MPDDFERAAEAFEEARKLPPGARSSFLDEACRGNRALREQVEALLGEHREGSESIGFRADSPLAGLSGLADLSGLVQGLEPGGDGDRDAEFPEWIGSYRILRKIGEGGMGVVFEAEQLSPRRKVALKVIRPGFASEKMVRRFRVESEVLAWLQHPGIAQVFEAGTADWGGSPLPYFAMERIDGKPLLEHADEKRLGSVERIELMVRICEAVEHAHQKGVIHRDLKPGNILVDGSGQPRVLDFGIARVIDPGLQAATLQTEAGQIVGTLLYMSPEQLEGKPEGIDTRSDVYAAGVILFELLSGRLPHDVRGLSVAQAIRVLDSRDPPLLGTIDGRLKGDLESIVSKALERERERRYPSAAALAEDLQRHLSHEPVTARPHTSLYQIRKFARRNRTLVGGIIGILLALAAGAAVAFQQMLVAREETARALRAKQLADGRLDQALKVSGFLQDMFGAADSRREGRDVRVVDILDRTAPRIERDLAGKPAIAAALHDAMGTAYYGLALYDRADEHLRRSLELWSGLPPEESSQAGQTRANLASVLVKKGDHAGARRELDEALRHQEGLGAGRNEVTAAILEGLGHLERILGNLDESERQFRASLAMRREILGPDHPRTLISMNHLANLLRYRGSYAEAQDLLEAALRIARAANKPDQDLVDTLQNLGLLLRDRGRIAEAKAHLEEALEESRKLLTHDHPDLAGALQNLAELQIEFGEPKRAEALLEEALEIVRKVHGPEHTEVAAILTSMGYLAYSRGDIKGFESNVRQSLEIRKKLLGEHHQLVAQSLYHLGMCAQWHRRDAEAVDLFEKAIAVFRETVSQTNPELANCLHILGTTLMRGGNAPAGIPHLREALDMRGKMNGIESTMYANTEYELAQALSRLEPTDFAEVERLCRHAIGATRKALGEESGDEAFYLDLLGVMSQRQGKLEEARGLLEQALQLRQRGLPKDDPDLNSNRRRLGACLLAMGRLEEAEKQLTESFRALLGHHGPASPAMRDHLSEIEQVYERLKQPEKAAEFRALLPPGETKREE